MRPRSHLTAALIALGALAACGSPPVSTLAGPTPVASQPAPDASAEAVPAPVVARARPSAEALVGRVRVSAIVAARKLLPPFAAKDFGNEITDELGLDRGILTAPDALQKLGIDQAGTITFETFELDEAGAAMGAKLHGLAQVPDDEDLSQSILHEHARTARPGWFMTRVRVPVSGDAFGDLLDRGLGRRGARRTEIRSGEVAYTLGRAVWHTKRDGDSMLVELALSERLTEARDVRDALGALGAWSPTTSQPLLAGEDLVVRMVPSAMTTAGFFLAMQPLGEKIDKITDPQALRRTLANAYRNARSFDTLDAPEGKPRYASVVITQSGDKTTLTSTFAADTEPPRAEDWADSGVDFTVDGSALGFSINGPLLYGWKMIAGRDGVNPYYGHDIGRTAERADFLAPFLFVGDAPFLFGRAAMEQIEQVGHATLPFVRKWDRVGAAVTTGPWMGIDMFNVAFVGILPKTATEENAACALARDDKKCAAKDRLRPNAVANRAGWFVMRKKIDGRWVVMVSRNEASLKTLPIHVTEGARSPFIAMIDPKRTAQILGLTGSFTLPVFHSTLGLANDKKSFTFTLQP